MEKKGFFVCIEGVDGCGKTTQAKFLVKNLNKRGFQAVYTAEPSNGKIGVFIRRYCLHVNKRIPPIVEALLFAADRFEHVKNEIVPSLNEGRIVISDRYLYSSLAYQGAAGVDLNWIKMVNEHAVKPDLAIYIDLEPEIVVNRLKSKKSVMENLENLRKVRDVYMKFVDTGELLKIDGNKAKNEVANEILEQVTKRLKSDL